MFDVADTNFKRLSYPELILLTDTVAGNLETHPLFQTNYPDVVPLPSHLREQNAALRAAVNAAANRDTQKIAERNSIRAALEDDLKIVAAYVVMKSIKENDPGLITAIGFELSVKSNSRSPITYIPLNAPGELIAKHGKMSGTVTLRARKVPGAVMYELQACDGIPTGEECWETGRDFKSCSKIQVDGCEPARRRSFRLRAKGDNNTHGPWSPHVTIIVL
ncbi:hypothetical protein [Geomesophilobacter sediminis]|uniref:Fibronectin type-III domain-containing protein n=1 Tax=Geomesophilobacter sediminis TaxID=2798584 RepID=A0A8J7LYJ9_9BACT|nr:hypothetical protein [Geomesophilobacter sediminis]MBJ6725206.1 hypothetical protein [Geomesophilobacter sediminis]